MYICSMLGCNFYMHVVLLLYTVHLGYYGSIVCRNKRGTIVYYAIGRSSASSLQLREDNFSSYLSTSFCLPVELYLILYSHLQQLNNNADLK